MELLANLGIDVWSMILYLVNILLLVIVLTWILYKPVMEFLEKRRNTIADSIAEAETLKKEFEEKLKAMEEERETAQRKMKEQMAKMKGILEQARTELIAEMEEKEQKLLDTARVEIERRKQKLYREAEETVLAAMEKVVLSVLQQKVPKNVVEESVQDSWKQFIANHNV